MPESSDQSRWLALPTGERLPETLGRFWTIPNVLSLLRLAVVVPITYLVWVDGSLEWLFGLIVFGALTDFLDGRVARWSHVVSGWGKVLDPLADKFAAVMVIFALTFRSAEPTLPLWFFGLIVGRDLCILAGGVAIARRTGQVAQSGAFGKAAVASLALTVLYAVLGADPQVLDYCVWVSTALLAGSFLIYVGRYVWVERTGTLPWRAHRESEPLREQQREDARPQQPGSASREQPASKEQPGPRPASNRAPRRSHEPQQRESKREPQRESKREPQRESKREPQRESKREPQREPRREPEASATENGVPHQS